MNALTSPSTENMVEIQGEGNVRGKKSAGSEANHVCKRTARHPSIPSLSSSKITSYINDITPVERDVEKEEGKG